jgi:hypothetical protein
MYNRSLYTHWMYNRLLYTVQCSVEAPGATTRWYACNAVEQGVTRWNGTTMCVTVAFRERLEGSWMSKTNQGNASWRAVLHGAAVAETAVTPRRVWGKTSNPLGAANNLSD